MCVCVRKRVSSIFIIINLELIDEEVFIKVFSSLSSTFTLFIFIVIRSTSLIIYLIICAQIRCSPCLFDHLSSVSSTSVRLVFDCSAGADPMNDDLPLGKRVSENYRNLSEFDGQLLNSCLATVSDAFLVLIAPILLFLLLSIQNLKYLLA